MVGSLKALDVSPVHELRELRGGRGSLQDVTHAFFDRTCAYAPAAYFIADALELTELWKWASSRSETQRRHGGLIEEAARFVGDPKGSWEHVLITSERTRLEWYRDFRPNGIYDLGQSQVKQVSSPTEGTSTSTCTGTSTGTNQH